MTAQQLFQAGKLDEAIQVLVAEVRDNPQDTKRRTFLFELLCFSGDLSRAEKHLDLAAQGSQPAEMGALLYHAALHAERTRQDLFSKQQYPMPKAAGLGQISVHINGKTFHSLADGDPRIGSNLEVFAAGSYMWIPFGMITSIEISAPKRLRDLLWLPAKVRTSDKFEERELGEVLLPVLTPFAAQHADSAVRLGRATVWEENSEGQVLPVGQKILIADDQEWPILELRNVEIATVQTAS